MLFLTKYLKHRTDPFINNEAGSYGGAVRFENYNVAMYSTLFVSNTVTGSYNPSWHRQGATVMVTNCLWDSASSTPNSGGDNLLPADMPAEGAGVELLLKDNGGPTMTHAVLKGSIAIDAGSNEYGLTNDQRGTKYDRVVGLASDIGAFEYGSGPAAGWLLFIK